MEKQQKSIFVQLDAELLNKAYVKCTENKVKGQSPKYLREMIEIALIEYLNKN